MLLDPGTYDVTASKTGYYDHTEHGVVIVAGEFTTVDFALSPLPMEVLATDSLGNPKTQFLPSEEVYAKGAHFVSTAPGPVKIYVIPDSKEALPGNAVASADATTDADGTLPNTLVWSPTLTVGNYDLWVDANKNGVLDWDDTLNDFAIGIKAFFVIPEPTIILSALLMFSALAAFYLTRMRKCA